MSDKGDELGRVVRETWVAWAKEQPDPKPGWLTPWEELDEGQREVDRRIGLAVAERILGQQTREADGISLERVDCRIDGVKRQYAPYLVHWICPRCGRSHTTDLRESYLSYPDFGKANREYLHCWPDESDDECYTGEIWLRLDICVSLADPPR